MLYRQLLDKIVLGLLPPNREVGEMDQCRRKTNYCNIQSI